MTALGYVTGYMTGRKIPIILADVEMCVDRLRDEDRAILAKGPLLRHSWKTGYCCRCCEVFDKFFDELAGYSSAVVQTLAEFHQDDLDQDVCVESYLRCILIYLCAGWDGRWRST